MSILGVPSIFLKHFWTIKITLIPLRRTRMESSGETTRISIVDGTIDPPPAPVRTTRRTEKAPLLQRKLFSSLGGLNGIINNPEQSGYTEFGNSTSSNSGGASTSSSSSRTLGTFAGVFCPVALSMFSALLFLRVGFIVGNAGLLWTLGQFVIAYSILTFTVFSICAISTNGAVEGGGAYFMISRTLGPEFGGAIGALFIVANIVSSALYITGCVEGIVDNFGPHGSVGDFIPNNQWWRFLYCSGLNCLNLVVCLIGASLFAKTSVAILTIVGVCLLSVFASYFQHGDFEVEFPSNPNDTGLFTGFNGTTLDQNLHSNYTVDYTSGQQVNFAIVFGVLFSGVTGIMAGANMSGELKVPGKSIPKGTLSAVGFTFVVYVLLSILTAATCQKVLLQNDFIFMMKINFWPYFVTVGIMTATFSASLSNLIGASRVLEAVAKDDIFGSMLRSVTKGTTESGNPVVAVLLCFFFVEMFLLIGALNVIAQLNSVLFLLSYFAMNLACLGLELASAPNFRPAFKYFSAHTASIGLVGTLVMMFVINAIYASMSIIACLVLVILLHLFSPSKSANWGSISQALIFHQVRKYLLLLDSRKDHVKFWRPHMLLLVANPRGCSPLINFVNDLKKSGLYVLGHVQTGDFDSMDSDPMDNYVHWLNVVDHLKVKAFINLTVARTVREGMHHLVRISGLGAMRPNTIVFGFHDELVPVDFFVNKGSDRFKDHFPLRAPDNKLVMEEWIDMVKDVIRMNKNAVIVRGMNNFDKNLISKTRNMFIDVWPINFFSGDANSLMDTTSLFLLQLACILNMVSSWKHLTLRVFLCFTNNTDQNREEAADREAELRRMLQILRIKARIVVVPWENVLNLQVSSGEPMVDSSPQWPVNTIKKRYIEGVNGMVREHSISTAVTFMYLPEPPLDSRDYLDYYARLKNMTEGVEPCLLVHGVSPVTSTSI
ncbi:unnamed protein product [Allacma fusca]|uniref:Solute carrier family 12 member 9 n=1 Tax=Allacma fusca TaxID=39272 RepID=A0A8J2KUU4_9HEXA|nr:unnamed protein product [Allacma fusca]